MRLKTICTILAVILLALAVTACSSNGKADETKSSSTAPSTNASSTVDSNTGAQPKEAIKELSALNDIAGYNGSDREQRLSASAKKEGALNIYTSLPQEDMQALAKEFEAKYGIKSTIWRASSETVVQRITTEAQGGKHDYDIVAGSSSSIEALYREKLLQEVNSPHLKNLMQSAVPKHKQWAPIYLNIFVQTYNTNAVKKDELPRTYQDLLNPRWKDRLGMEETDYEWFMAVVQQMGEEKGLTFFKNLASQNISIRKGRSLLAELVATGEVPYAVTTFSYKARQLKKKGAPVDWHYIEPAIARSTAVAVSNKSPHPNASVLFYDFLLSDGQKILADMSYDTINEKYQTDKIPLTFIDDVAIFEQSEKWTKLFDEIILKKKK